MSNQNESIIINNFDLNLLSNKVKNDLIDDLIKNTETPIEILEMIAEKHLHDFALANCPKINDFIFKNLLESKDDNMFRSLTRQKDFPFSFENECVNHFNYEIRSKIASMTTNIEHYNKLLNDNNKIVRYHTIINPLCNKKCFNKHNTIDIEDTDIIEFLLQNKNISEEQSMFLFNKYKNILNLNSFDQLAFNLTDSDNIKKIFYFVLNDTENKELWYKKEFYENILKNKNLSNQDLSKIYHYLAENEYDKYQISKLKEALYKNPNLKSSLILETMDKFSIRNAQSILKHPNINKNILDILLKYDYKPMIEEIKNHKLF